MSLYIFRNKFLLIIELLIATMRGISEVILSFSMGGITNAAIDRNTHLLFLSSLICTGSLLAIYVFYVLENYLRKTLSGKCLYAIKKDLYESLSRKNEREFHHNPDSWYLNILQSDMDVLERDYFDAMWRMANMFIQSLFCMIALAFVSVKLFFIFAVVSIIPEIISRFFKKTLAKTKDAFSKQNTICIQKQKEFISGFDTIFHFDKNHIFVPKLLAEDKNLEQKRRKKDVYNVMASYGATTLNMIASIVCMASAAYFVAVGELRFGDLTTSTQLLNYIFTPLNAAIGCFITVLSTSSLREKIISLINNRKDGGLTSFENGNIVYNNVSLGYGNHTIVENFSRTFVQGKKYAIIGTSGAGKSTIMKALLKGTDITEGSITINNEDISNISLDSLCQNVLYVPQNTFLFEGTVRENISLFENNTKVDEYAKLAFLPEKLLDQKAGGDHGKQLSGGEMTRISVARALCSSAPIIIFDEPASGLDPDTAREIEKLISNMTEKTIFVITHNWDEQYLRSFDEIVRI